MEDLLSLYADLICTRQLKLNAGDLLSVHSEKDTYGFAKTLAQTATRYTRATVNIVITNRGKVEEIIPMDPVIPEVMQLDGKGQVLCRILSFENNPLIDDEDPTAIVKEPARISTYNMLGEPLIVDRRIAVPWAVIPIPGMNFIRALVDEIEALDGTEPLRLLETLYRLDLEDPGTFWDNQIRLLHYRKIKLNAIRTTSLYHITNSETELSFRKAHKTTWEGGESTLPNGRNYTPSLPSQSIHATLNYQTVNGTVKSTRPFIVLGKEVKDAQFTIKEGRVISFDAKQGKEALAAFFHADLNANVASSISLADHRTSESTYLKKGIHPSLTTESSVCLGFGAIQTDTLALGETLDTLSDKGILSCLVRMIVPIGSADLRVSISEGAEERNLMIDGNFEE